MTVQDLTQLIMCFNYLLDSGKHDGISVAETSEHIAGGDVLTWLQGQVGPDAGFILPMVLEKKDLHQEYITRLQAIRDVFAGDERRKWGVQNRGLCLLVAWTCEILQQGKDLKWT